MCERMNKLRKTERERERERQAGRLREYFFCLPFDLCCIDWFLFILRLASVKRISP